MKSKLTWSEGSVRSVALVAMLALAACASEVAETTEPLGKYDDSELEAIDAQLQRMGLDTSSVEYLPEREVRVEGDMVFDVDTLMDMAAEASEEVEGFELDEETTEKGYYWSITSNRLGSYARVPSGSVSMTFSSDVPDVWRTAFRDAAAAWSNSNPCISIREGGSGYPLNIQMSSTITAIADAKLPKARTSRGVAVGYNPGDRIRVSTLTFLFSTNQRAYTALHEMGHTLGYMHPREGTHIAGTSSGTSYASVMSTPLPSSPRTTLSSDDITSRNKLFKQGYVTSGRTRVWRCLNDGTVKL